MRTLVFRAGLLGVFALLLVTPVVAKGGATITVSNESRWEIHHLYLSSTDDQYWGPDQLGEDIIRPGHTFKLTDIPCNKYDVKVVDEDGDACVINSIKMCGDAQVWHLTNEELLSCEGSD